MNFTPNANSLVARRGSERVVGDGEGLSTLTVRQGVKYVQLVIKSWRIFELKKSLVELFPIYPFL